jgi:hypothetical protein
MQIPVTDKDEKIMSYSEEWEAQQEANRLLEALKEQSGQATERYQSYEVPEYSTNLQRTAVFLWMKGYTIQSLVSLGNGEYRFNFATRGEEPAKTAKVFEEGKMTFPTGPFVEAAQKRAQDEIRGLISDYERANAIR